MGYFNTFYLTNVLVILLYPLHKLVLHLNTQTLHMKDSFGFTYENSILYMMLTLLVLNYIRSYSLPQFISEALVLLKVMIFCFYTFAGMRYALGYVAVCLIHWLLISYPKYTGPHKFTRIPNQQAFDELMKGDRKEVVKECKKIQKIKSKQTAQKLDYENKKMWFIEFYADWAPTCLHARQIWCEFSMRYSNNSLRFGSVNLAKNPELAERFSINTTGFSRQLPTVIIFEDGEEAIRFPPIDKKTKKIPKVLKYESKGLAKYFDLEQRYLQTRALQHQVAPAPQR